VKTWQKVLLIVFLLALAVGGGAYVVPAIIDLVGRGRRLNDTSGNLVDLSIQVDPDELASAAGDVMGRPVSLDALALARMARSEEGSAPREVKALLCHVAMNDAAAHGWSVLHTITVSSNPSRSGLFGNQTSRRYSSVSDPYEEDLLVAEGVISARASGGGDADPTGGAVKFFNRGKLLKSDPPADWYAEGLQSYNVAPAPDRLLFFARNA
jgi:hypothetical protein